MNMLELLQHRYPEIAFALQFTPFTPQNLCEEELEFESPLEEIEVLYLFGIGAYFSCVKQWLQGRNGRLLIVLEDDLGKIAAFLETSDSKFFLESPNVCLKYVQNWEDVLEQLPTLYPTDRLLVSAVKSYQKKRAAFFKKVQLKLYRNSASISALLSEVLYSHKLFANVYPNLLKMPQSFFANRFKGAFKGIPAVICGAGPSLEKTISELKNMEQEALLIAGGSAITAFGHHQITPHFCMALDPNLEEYERLKGALSFEVPFLYASRLQKDVFNTCNGPYGYMKSDTGGLAEEWFEKKLKIDGDAIGPELGREAFSVTTMAVAFAYEMGCNPIIFAGVDLAFTGMHRYAAGIVENSGVEKNELAKDVRVTDKLVSRKDRHGNKVDTLIKWVMESDTISAFATRHPETTFINATDGGIGFSKVPYQSMQEVRQTYCKGAYDLRGKIHMELQKSPFAKDLEDRLKTATKELSASLKRCLGICAEINEELKKHNKESGKMVVLQMDLKEEVAFECFLQPLEFAIDRLLARYFFESAIESARARFSQMEIMIQNYLKVLNIQSVYSAASAE